MSGVLDALDSLLGAIRPLLSPAALVGAEHSRYGGYLLREGDRDASFLSKARYGGSDLDHPPQPANFVAQLNRDLRACGYLQAPVGGSEHVFTRGTELALREFQADLAGTRAGRLAAGGKLEGVPRSASPVQVCGFLYPPTGSYLAEWVAAGLRCPVRIVARRQNVANGAAAEVEVWAAADLEDPAYRMHAEDVSNVFHAGPWEGSVGKWTTKQGRPGGPYLFPGEARLADGDPPGIGDDAVRRAVRAVAAAETARTWDAINAWDGVGISTGLFHWQPYSGELGALAAYLQARAPAAYDALFARQGLSYPRELAWDTSLAPTGQRSYRPKERKWVVPLRVMGRNKNEPFAWTDIGRKTKQPFHELFATWRWVTRMAEAARSPTFHDYRVAQAEMGVMRLQALMSTPMVISNQAGDQRTVSIGDVYRTRLAMAVILRMHVIYPVSVLKDGQASEEVVKAVLAKVAWNDDLASVPDATIDAIAEEYATIVKAKVKGSNLDAAINDAKAVS